MAKENVFIAAAKKKGLLDHREICVVADVACNRTNVGRLWVMLNGDILYMCQMDGFQAPGECLESIDLKNAQLNKSSSFVLHSYMVLQCGNYTWRFQGFAQAKRVIEAVNASCSK